MNEDRLIHAALEQGGGILRLAPTWVPRSFCIPGRRIKLHPDDYYALGAHRGGIDERWLASTTPADNGPLTLPDEGLSYVVMEDGPEVQRILLRDAVALAGSAIIGPRLMRDYGGWPMFAKFFDNLGPLPHHLHHQRKDAERVSREPKPEAYFFPTQLNNHGGRFPFTFFGLEPGTTREEVKECLRNWNQGDNKILNLSRAYKLEPGTGWDVPAGVLHAPGSLCTYEPQYASDVFAMFQSLVDNVPMPWELVVKDVPEEHKHDLDYLVDMLDWEANLNPNFARDRFMRPRPVHDLAEMKAEGYIDEWVAYRSPDFSAKQTTILPGCTVTLRDAACYGLILLQGHGTMGVWEIETPALIRFGQLTHDEFFVSEEAARAGVKICNPSFTDPIVMLRHYGPGNPELKLQRQEMP
ncbi:MAG: hypothetical protein H5T69_00175 [Chloroflexi bacterium]|nr:hypothetical protein [Chloroflexota bacterium]